MKRRVPDWFTRGKARDHFHSLWPWAMSSVCAAMYFYNREPFEDMAASVVTKVRKPLLKGMEWIELHDVDPETMALELPPDMIFGPLEFEQQMKFLLAALKSDNEYADGYLARIFVDHMDISLDQPLLKEERFLTAGGKELLDFGIEDFTGARKDRRHIFFHPDEFLRLVNLIAPYPQLTEYFVTKKDGVQLVLKALKHSHDEAARVLAMRSLCMFAFTQKRDGDVEKRILNTPDGMKDVLEAYRQSTGDPTDTRYLTLLLSSMMRLYPEEGGKAFLDENGVQVTVNNLNIARYKGLPQHLRVLHDAQRLPPKATGKESVNNRIFDADFIPVALGVVDSFPEYYEVVEDILATLEKIVPSCATPFELLEYRAMPILAKLYVRWSDNPAFQTDGTRSSLVRVFQLMLNDPTCQRCFPASVASHELQECLKTAKVAIEAERTHYVTPPPDVNNNNSNKKSK